MVNTVLITGARSIAALDLARDFYCAGYEVHMADSSRSFIARFSHIPAVVHRYASPNTNPEEFTLDIERLIKTVKPDLIIPTCEEVFHLSKPSLAACIKGLLFAPPLSTLHNLHAKDCFAELCQSLNITMPETHRLECVNDLNTYQKNLADWVFKPCFSRFGAETLIAPNRKELASIVPDVNMPWIAQRRVVGQELSFYAVFKDGALCGLSAYKSSWRLRGGASFTFTPASEEIITQIIPIAQNIATHTKFNGQLSCDFIIDGTGRIWLIECNPRATSGLHLLTGEGLLAKVIAGTEEIQPKLSGQTHYMLPMMLSWGLVHATLNNKWREWLHIINAGTDVVGTKKDRLPLLGAALDSIIFAQTGWRKSLSVTQATTADIEWNGEKLT